MRGMQSLCRGQCISNTNLSAGDRYDGEFHEGEEDGLGVFTWADGSTYDGFWCQGRKHGLGVYRPAAAEPTSRRSDHRHTGDAPGTNTHACSSSLSHSLSLSLCSLSVGVGVGVCRCLPFTAFVAMWSP